MSGQLTPELVIMAIENGMLDSSIEAIREAVDVRREILAKRAASALNPGDQFLIKDCRPKKWNGEMVIFAKHDGIWLVCRTADTGEIIRLRTSHVGTIFAKGSTVNP